MDWQKRLYDHEESPPPSAWEAIREEVSSLPTALGKKLGTMEVQPPAELWQGIKKAVGQGSDTTPAEETRKIPVRGSVRSLPSRAFAYAASVAGVGLVLSLAYWYQTVEKNEGFALGGGNPIRHLAETNRTGSPTETDHTSRAGMDEAVPDSVFPLRFTQARRSSDPGKIELCDNRGNCVAVSSKMRELTESMGPTVSASAAKTVRSRKWNRTLRRWQKRLQNSQYLPNPGNLFDIDQLADLLNDRP